MFIIIIFVIILGLFFLSMLVKPSKTDIQSSTEKKSNSKMTQDTDFHCDVYLNGFANKYEFLVDKKKKQVLYIRHGLNHFRIQIPFKNIIGAQFSSDGNNISQKASYIRISIQLRNMNITTLVIDCYGGPCTPQLSTTGLVGIEYRESRDKAEALMNVINYIVDDNKNNQNIMNISSTQQVSVTSVADEISKLNKLKNDGVLTQEEFEAQKQKLLSKP